MSKGSTCGIAGFLRSAGSVFIERLSVYNFTVEDNHNYFVIAQMLNVQVIFFLLPEYHGQNGTFLLDGMFLEWNDYNCVWFFQQRWKLLLSNKNDDRCSKC